MVSKFAFKFNLCRYIEEKQQKKDAMKARATAAAGPGYVAPSLVSSSGSREGFKEGSASKLKQPPTRTASGKLMGVGVGGWIPLGLDNTFHSRYFALVKTRFDDCQYLLMTAGGVRVTNLTPPASGGNPSLGGRSKAGARWRT